ncbi:MAG: glutamine synthetase III [Gemmatimonadetes bacterium]|nr:glutamine synthetase III [Gemmatimonadota bacterium]
MTKTQQGSYTLAAARYQSIEADTPNEALTDIYGRNLFGLDQMRSRLGKSDFRSIQATMNGETSLDPQVAESVALAMKNWAIERGATHYTHWFQPLTGSSAEKHDSFLKPIAGGAAITEFKSSELLQGEPDASSFPSGGLRATFEARGYTAWDPTSPAFLMERPSGAYLCIPSAFLSWAGEALDMKTPLLRSMDALDKQARRALRLFGDENPGPVRPTCGAEQEFFLVDEEFFYRRPDLVASSRTLFGTKPPKGQEMDDHYFGSIPGRILEYMNAVERELYLLGVPATTRHNEVAPGQYEMAPVFEEANQASDHQLITMSTMRNVARRFGLVCLFHEKPFQGVNGSGKHLNWSMSTSNANLLEPGDTPHENRQFLFFCSAVLKAVHRHQDLLRATVAHAGNDHRLGANEAPPAIISAFMGAQLEDIFRQLENAGEATSSKASGLLGTGVRALPEIPKHSGDRNRTSPFAFTGNKFEFRALGSSQNVAFPTTVLNTIAAESLDELCEELEAAVEEGLPLEDGMRVVLSRETRGFRPVIFNGDNYSDEWVVEAEKRGLHNLRTTMDALPIIESEKNKALFDKYNVLSPREVESRYETYTEQYAATVNIEGQTAQHMAQTMFLPAAVEYLKNLVNVIECADEVDLKVRGVNATARTVSDLIDRLVEKIEPLAEENQAAAEMEGTEMANHVRDRVIPAMDEVRDVVDRLERIVPDELWPVPAYRDMLFVR